MLCKLSRDMSFYYTGRSVSRMLWGNPHASFSHVHPASVTSGKHGERLGNCYRESLISRRWRLQLLFGASPNSRPVVGAGEHLWDEGARCNGIILPQVCTHWLKFSSMADITLRLIWYRLGETRGKMAEAAGQAWQWYEDFTWSDHILDILLFGFIGWAGLCMLVLKAWVLVFGPIQFRQTERSREGGQKISGHTGEGEGLLWLNSTLNWFYLHYNVFPQFVGTWLKSLNDQAQKLGVSTRKN